MNPNPAQRRRLASKVAQSGDQLLDNRSGLGRPGPETRHGARRRSPIGNRVDVIRRCLNEPLMRSSPEHPAFVDQLAGDGFVVMGGPVGDDGDVLLVVDAADESAIRSTLTRDPRSQSGILYVMQIHRWTILLDAWKQA
jgi:uncharacterized protein YciI